MDTKRYDELVANAIWKSGFTAMHTDSFTLAVSYARAYP
jgi:hypothetical protein